MTELDVRTLLISVAALNILLTVTMVLYWRTQRVYRGFGLWTVCNALMALSYILFFLRGEISPFVSIVVASGVGGLGAVFRLEALRRFFGRAHFDYRVLALPVLVAALMAYYTYARDDGFARALVVSAGGAVVFWANAGVMASRAQGRSRLTYPVVAALFFAYGSLALARGIFWITQHSGTPLLQNNAVNLSFYLSTVVLDVAWTILFIAMNHQRTAGELKKAVRVSEDDRARLENIIAFLPDATFVVDLERRVIGWNRAAEVLSGVSAKDALGRSHDEVLGGLGGGPGPRLVDFVLDPAVSVAGRYGDVEIDGDKITAIVRTARPDGRPATLWASAIPLRDGEGKVTGAIECIRDITDRERSEELLEESEERYRALFELNLDGVLMTTTDGAILDANPAALRMLQMTVDEVRSAGRARVIKRSSESDHALAERDRTGSFSGKVFFIRKDGASFPTECSSVVLPGYEDPPLAFVIFRDISERMIAEAELRESEARLVRAQAVAHVGNWEMELPSKEMWASAEAKRIYGLPSDSPHFSHEIARSVPLEEEHPRLDAALDDLVTGRGPYDLEFRIRRAEDGAIRLIHSTADLAADESGMPTRVVGVIEDITERRRAEAALKESEELLLQSQKMEAVGQLAGGIAHDFNNLLTAIIGYSDLVLGDERVENLSAWDDVHEIKAAAERASALTRQILAFSRRQALRPRVTSLNDILIGMEPLLRRTLGEDIELVSRRQPDLGLTEVDTHQFEQVLMNLAINSRDAMPLGGRLIFETCNIELDEDSCRTRPDVMPGSYVMLSVADTGVGMDPDTASHIFEPFFTTKGPGEGTGLGLSTVYGIVRQSGGSIEVFSEPGAGTMFKVLLPRATRPAGAPARVSPQETPAHGGETILIVEDDPSLRNLVSRVLKNLGYTTVVADDAEAAFAVLRDENRPVDLLLTDIVLPGSVRGDILAQRAIDMRPGLPVLHMSGYARDTSLQTGTLDEGINFIAKPFTPEMLGKMVREVLDRSPSRSA